MVQREREREREIERGREKIKWEKMKLWKDFFCKYLPLWCHVACHVGVGSWRGTFGTSNGTLNKV